MKRHFLSKIAVAVTIMVTVLFLNLPAVQAQSFHCDSEYAPQITYLGDGSYIVSVVKEFPNNSARLASTRKNGSKTSTGYSPTGEKLFSLTVYGTFSYNGSAAKATNATYSYTLDSSSYTFKDGSSYCSGATAYASGIFKNLFESKMINVSLACSKDGRLS